MPKAQPSPEVMAIIVASVEAVWPRAVIVDPRANKEAQSPAWRFSGRPWKAPVAASRARPTFTTPPSFS